MNNNWIKLSKYAKHFNISYRTAHRHFHNDNIPYETKTLPSGTLLVNLINLQNEIFANRDAIIYCRVSSTNKKEDLIRQIQRCEDFAISNGFNILKIYKEIASGMNDNRRELNKLFDELPNKNFTIIIENKDRLTRFGFNYIKRFVEQMGSKINIININDDDQVDLIKDLVSIITSFCCRLYGLRRGANKAREIKDNILSK